MTETFIYMKRVCHPKSVINGRRQTRLHLVLKRDKDLTKPLHENVFITCNLSLLLDGIHKTMTSLFGERAGCLLYLSS